MNGRPRFGLDLDGVVYNWDAITRRLIKDEFGIDIPVSKNWNFIESQLTPEQNHWLWTVGIAKGMFRDGEFYEGALPAVWALAENTTLAVLTTRPVSAIPDTLSWLSKNGILAKEIYFLHDGRRKGEISCDIYLDDASHHLLNLIQSRPEATILGWRRPWNEDIRHMGEIKWVESWREVLHWERIVRIAEETLASMPS